MSIRIGALVGVAFLSLMAAGCEGPSAKGGFDQPFATSAEVRDETFGVFTYMADNAILHDMSIADIHFIAHTTELSGTGVIRLTRFAKLLNAYGGTVRYETFESDEDLIRQRLDHVREFMASLDCDMERVQFAAMISGGRGMRAEEAIRVLEKGTVDSSGASAQFGSPPGGG